MGLRDAESMFVDPLTKDIWIISKTNPDGDTNKHVYVAPYPQSTTATTTLTEVTTLPVSTHLTSADISPDGSEIIMRGDASTTGLMYIRPTGGTIADALATTPISIPLIDRSAGGGDRVRSTRAGLFYQQREAELADQLFQSRSAAGGGDVLGRGWDDRGKLCRDRGGNGRNGRMEQHGRAVVHGGRGRQVGERE